MGDRETAFLARVARYQRKRGLQGFFSVYRWEGGRPLRVWTASILVKRAGETGTLEYGGMSYVLGEVAFAWKKELLGEYYPYRCRGEHDHEHDFLSVLARAVLSDGQVEAEGGRDYAPWMLAWLDRVRKDAALRRRLRPWAEKPWKGTWRLARPVTLCRAGGKRHRCRNEEAVYELAARHWRDFCLETPENLSPSQRENVRGILDYQRAAHEGTAD